MESYEIIAGFSDIKLALQSETRTTKELNVLSLWFSVNNNELLVHDYNKHTNCLTLATFEPDYNAWEMYLFVGSYGYKLVLEIADSMATPHEAAKELNRLFKLYGFTAFGRF